MVPKSASHSDLRRQRTPDANVRATANTGMAAALVRICTTRIVVAEATHSHTV